MDFTIGVVARGKVIVTNAEIRMVTEQLKINLSLTMSQIFYI